MTLNPSHTHLTCSYDTYMFSVLSNSGLKSLNVIILLNKYCENDSTQKRLHSVVIPFGHIKYIEDSLAELILLVKQLKTKMII